MALVWFITGASSGIGLELCLTACRAGHTVIGTVRDRKRSADAVAAIESAGGKCVILDVSHVDSIPAVVQDVVQKEGRIDVLVNNAGYSLLGAVEDMSLQESRHQMETNFFGPLCLMQAVIPGMRERRSGTIVNVSSVAALSALPSCGLYSASKFALEGVSESLSHELAPFNIRMLIVEPGAFRTNFLHAGVYTAKPLNPAYNNTPLATILSKFDTMRGTQSGDPKKAAKVMFEAVVSEGAAAKVNKDILRLPLGHDGIQRMEAKIEGMTRDLEETRDIAKTTDID